ncbi:hypothetical protein Scep_004058 [Stephania cephalantha]|uniref:Uncharacterized protein n=1 Tax=Stephania cephalantha TaxID=152367 RepID=A0AAP0KUJ5_9MAGN
MKEADAVDQRESDTWQVVWCDEEKFGFVIEIVGESGSKHFEDIKELWYTVYMNVCLNCVTWSFLYTQSGVQCVSRGISSDCTVTCWCMEDATCGALGTGEKAHSRKRRRTGRWCCTHPKEELMVAGTSK